MPQRKALADYAREPGLPPPDEGEEAAAEAAAAAAAAAFDYSDSDDDSQDDWYHDDAEEVIVQLPQGLQLVLPFRAVQQLQERVAQGEMTSDEFVEYLMQLATDEES
eukprot:SAG31_NODE_3578_length_4103_cov_1.960789_7_plen_107_part_00